MVYRHRIHPRRSIRVAWPLAIAVALLFSPATAVEDALADPGTAAPAYVVIPFQFQGHLPMLPVTVQGLSLRLMLDTGDRDGIVLRPTVLNRLRQVRYTGTVRHGVDVRGKASSSREYELDDVSIGKLQLGRVKGSVYHPWGLTAIACTPGSNCRFPDLADRQGIIGLDALNHGALILDYPNQRIVVIDNSAEPPGYAIDRWIKTPFHLDANGIQFEVNLDDRSRSLVLDTGATMSVFKRRSLNATSFLTPCAIRFPDDTPCKLYAPPRPKIQDRLLSSLEFYVYPYTSPTGDALVGYQFLSRNIVYLDFRSHLMAIKPVGDDSVTAPVIGNTR